MGLRVFGAAALLVAWTACLGLLVVVTIGPEGKGVTVDGAWATVALAGAGAALTIVAVTQRDATQRRTVITSCLGLCLAVGAPFLLFALAER
jgi:4-amino-4-deoxy-L-arabinose transferase-like glycosyltransferase